MRIELVIAEIYPISSVIFKQEPQKGDQEKKRLIIFQDVKPHLGVLKLSFAAHIEFTFISFFFKQLHCWMLLMRLHALSPQFVLLWLLGNTAHFVLLINAEIRKINFKPQQ